jgi:hypothetical protein
VVAVAPAASAEPAAVPVAAVAEPAAVAAMTVVVHSAVRACPAQATAQGQEAAVSQAQRAIAARACRMAPPA